MASLSFKATRNDISPAISHLAAAAKNPTPFQPSDKTRHKPAVSAPTARIGAT